MCIHVVYMYNRISQFYSISARQAISQQPDQQASTNHEKTHMGEERASERPVQRGVPVLRQGIFAQDSFAGGWVGHQLHCMHPRRCEIGFMPASARFAPRVSKVEERPEGAHDVAQRHARRSQVTAVQQVLEAGKQLQKCVSSQCRDKKVVEENNVYSGPPNSAS